MERYFLASNSGRGFWSEYDSQLKDVDRVALIKGGSGTGKSTLLKKIAVSAKTRGMTLRYGIAREIPKALTECI